MTIHEAWRATKSVGHQCVSALPLVIGGIRAVRRALYSERGPRELEPAELDKARRSPWNVFRSPMEVMSHAELSTDYKKEVLKTWEEDAKHLSIAEGEGMGGGEPNRLSDVAEAKRKLNADAAPRHDESDVIVVPPR